MDMIRICALPLFDWEWRSEHIPKKYVQCKWVKRNAAPADIPKLSPTHEAENRVLSSLGDGTSKTILTPNIYRFHLKKRMEERKSVSGTIPGLSFDTHLTEVDTEDGMERPEALTVQPSSASNHSAKTPVEPDLASLGESSVVLTVTFDEIESPFEWSARMKRYQQEEIQYLGLDVIKPRRSEHPENAAASLAVSVSTENTPRKYMKLSKQRFEEWLDTLSPRANPVIPASQPSTVAESEEFQANSSDSGSNSALYQAQQNPSEYVTTVNSKICNECGKRIRSENANCDRSVQTDITGGLIIF
jgi:hypothetical protein